MLERPIPLAARPLLRRPRRLVYGELLPTRLVAGALRLAPVLDRVPVGVLARPPLRLGHALLLRRLVALQLRCHAPEARLRPLHLPLCGSVLGEQELRLLEHSHCRAAALGGTALAQCAVRHLERDRVGRGVKVTPLCKPSCLLSRVSCGRDTDSSNSLVDHVFAHDTSELVKGGLDRVQECRAVATGNCASDATLLAIDIPADAMVIGLVASANRLVRDARDAGQIPHGLKEPFQRCGAGRGWILEVHRRRLIARLGGHGRG